MRLTDADKLPEHKFTRESAKSSDYMRGWNDAIDAIVDNAPTVELRDVYNQGYFDGKKVVKDSLTTETIPIKDLINYIRTCREELFEKMKDYHPKEFEIRDSMLTNFEQIVRLASSKHETESEANNE